MKVVATAGSDSTCPTCGCAPVAFDKPEERDQAVVRCEWTAATNSVILTVGAFSLYASYSIGRYFGRREYLAVGTTSE